MSSPDALTTVQAGLLAFLEEGPQTVAELAAYLEVPQALVRAECHGLRAAGVAQALRADLWALAGYEVPAPRPTPPPSGAPRKAQVKFCRRCRTRLAQAAGLCRRCGRETGAVTQTTKEIEAARVARHQARQPVPLLRAQERRANGVRIIDGVEFEVVFDGSQPLLPDRDSASSLLPAIRNTPAAVIRKDRGAMR